MERRYILRLLALCAALVLCLSALAEELGELDLYDPSIYVQSVELDAEGVSIDEWGDGEEEIWQELPGEEIPTDFEALKPYDPAAEIQAPEGKDDAGTGLSITPSDSHATADLYLGLGERFKLGGSMKRYASEQPDIVSVDAKTGLATALAVGMARITAVKKSGGTASCIVAVLNAPGSVSLEPEALTLGKGETFRLSVKLPEGTASGKLVFASSKSSVVSVDGAGKLKAKKAGSAVIGVAAFNGVKGYCKVKVLNAPSRIAVSEKKLLMNVGETRALAAKLPSGCASAITWQSSDTAVATVDASGNVKAVGTGVAVIRARTFNGKKADCKVTVLAGSAPTKLSAGVNALTLGVGERFTLAPSVGDGEYALFAFASSDKAVAAVSAKGVIVGRKAGAATVTVATHNGLKVEVPVTVGKAPASVTLSQTSLALEVGQTSRLTATLPAGCASAITWESSAPDIARVDENGVVTAVAVGSAGIRARTFNGKLSPVCTVNVSEAGEFRGYTDSVEKMVANLRASGALGAKRDAIANVVGLLASNGFEPAFAAGVAANVYAEGTYGLFESSKYIVNYKKRPRYFCYLDGGEYYVNGVLTAVYMSAAEKAAYTGSAEARLRFAEENFYRDNYSGKFVQNVNLTQLEKLMEKLAEGGWEGKFGLGIVQWTGARTQKLVTFYRKHAGENTDTITAAQAVAAENEMILYDLKGGYSGVYTGWRSANSGALNTEKAARSAGSLVCTRYEIPANKESKAVTRGNKAAEIYRIMMG